MVVLIDLGVNEWLLTRNRFVTHLECSRTVFIEPHFGNATQVEAYIKLRWAFADGRE